MTSGSLATSDAQGGRILLVEDDPDAARFVLTVLRRRGGYEIVHTADPAIALGLARSESWDLVLTDVEMPGMTGLELLELVRQTDPGFRSPCSPRT